MNYEQLQYSVDDHIALIQFDGTDRYNIFTEQMEREFQDVWESVTRDDYVRAVILTGKENTFVTGSDLRTMNVNNISWMMDQTTRVQQLFNKVESLPKPTLSAINGYATGAGLQLALACDFRIASETASFALPEVKLGIIPSAGATQRLARLVGMEYAKWLIFSGERISAKDAKRMRLISRTTEPDDLLVESYQILRSIIANAPVAIANSKLCINMGIDMTLEQGLALERNSYTSLCMTEDAVEGIDAFLNRRPPVFKGR